MKMNVNEFYEKLGELVSEYFGFVTIIRPDDLKADEKAVEAKELSKAQKLKEEVKKNSTSAGVYNGTDEEAAIFERVVAEHPEIRLRNESETFTRTKKGVLCCENAAMWMIHKANDNGRLFGETLDVAIAAHMHENANGLCAPALLMIFRILALHPSARVHKKVKELLTEILKKNTVNAITVLAKATEKYTQRNVNDQRVMYLEDLISAEPGIRNQFEVG